MNLKERLPSPAEIERGVWSLLCDTLASRTIVVLSMDLFNPTELDLARGRSLERTACDYLARWRRSDVAAKLMQCAGLVIRLRSAAALWIRKREKGHDASLHFVPQWEEPDRSEYGRMSGKNAVVISALTRQLVEWLVEHPGQSLSADALVEQAAKAIDLALRIQPTMHRDGFGSRWPDQSELRARGLFHGCNFGRLAGAPPTVDVAHYEIPRLPTENSLRALEHSQRSLFDGGALERWGGLWPRRPRDRATWNQARVRGAGAGAGRKTRRGPFGPPSLISANSSWPIVRASSAAENSARACKPMSAVSPLSPSRSPSLAGQARVSRSLCSKSPRTLGLARSRS